MYSRPRLWLDDTYPFHNNLWICGNNQKAFKMLGMWFRNPPWHPAFHVLAQMPQLFLLFCNCSFILKERAWPAVFAFNDT